MNTERKIVYNLCQRYRFANRVYRRALKRDELEKTSLSEKYVLICCAHRTEAWNSYVAAKKILNGYMLK